MPLDNSGFAAFGFGGAPRFMPSAGTAETSLILEILVVRVRS